MSDKDKLESPKERLQRLTHEFDQAMRDAVPEADVQHLIRQYQDIIRVHGSIHNPWAGAGQACAGPDMGELQQVDSTWEPCSLANLEREVGLNLDSVIRHITNQGFDLVVRATTTRGTPA